MTTAPVANLPKITLPQPAIWYRGVAHRLGRLPPRASTGRTRFNDGSLRILYFAPTAQIARFEARALLGSFFHAAVPAPGQHYVVIQYQITLGGGANIVDAREQQLPVIGTTIQEMTGDWYTYPRGVPHARTIAPTQELAEAIYRRMDRPIIGLIAPSARNPWVDNLILSEDRLPAQSVGIVAPAPPVRP